MLRVYYREGVAMIKWVSAQDYSPVSNDGVYFWTLKTFHFHSGLSFTS